MDILIHLNGKEYRANNWEPKPPSKGDIFNILIHNGEPCSPGSWLNEKHQSFIVDRISYLPYFNGKVFDFKYTSFEVYLEPVKKAEQNPKNID